MALTLRNSSAKPRKSKVLILLGELSSIPLGEGIYVKTFADSVETLFPNRVSRAGGNGGRIDTNLGLGLMNFQLGPELTGGAGSGIPAGGFIRPRLVR